MFLLIAPYGFQFNLHVIVISYCAKNEGNICIRGYAQDNM